MKTMTAIGAVLVNAAMTVSAAQAQSGYGAQSAPQQSAATGQAQPGQAATAQAQAVSPTAIKTHNPKISREASKPLQALQSAVNANDAAAIAAALPAAQAAAKSAEDRYAIGILQLKAAAAASNHSAIAAAIETMLASGAVLEDEKFGLYFNLGQSYSTLKQNDRAAQAFQQAVQINPNSVEATAGLAEAQVAQGKVAEGLALLQKGIAVQATASGRAPEAWYKRAVSVAFEAKLPQAVDISRDWVKAYPTSSNWSNALAIFQNVGQLDESRTLDLLRLKRTTGSMSAGDYFNYGDIAVRKGFAGEAKAVLEEGFSANQQVKRSDPSFSQLYALATQKAKGDKESLPVAPVAGATARQTLNIGDAYYGYGDYAKAVEFYRAALTRPGAEPDVINLHLGMALARQGDKAGATTALKAVGGQEAAVAKYWLLFVETKA